MKRVSVVFLLGLLGLGLLACGSDDNGNGDEQCDATQTCTEANTLCVVVHLPQDFSAKPLKLWPLVHSAIPPAGMPAAMFTAIDNPDDGGCGFYKMQVDTSSFSGSGYFYVELLVEGGGAAMPEPEVDFVAGHADELDFSQTPINLPELHLELFQTP